MLLFLLVCPFSLHYDHHSLHSNLLFFFRRIGQGGKDEIGRGRNKGFNISTTNSSCWLKMTVGRHSILGEMRCRKSYRRRRRRQSFVDKEEGPRDKKYSYSYYEVLVLLASVCVDDGVSSIRTTWQQSV